MTDQSDECPLPNLRRPILVPEGVGCWNYDVLVCGRFVGAFSTERLLAEFGEVVTDHGFAPPRPDGWHEEAIRPNFNLAPTQHARVLRAEFDSLVLESMTWGLVPRWARDRSRASSMINARSETVGEKPSFRGLLGGNRCIVPMSGFYEWDRSNPRVKVPYFCERADGRLMLVAGLWTTSPASDEEATFCILTRPSGPDLEAVHDRSPMHLDAEGAIHWLKDGSPPLELASPDEEPELVIRRVSSRVNSVRNNGSDLIDPVAEEGASGDDATRPTLF